MDTVKELQSSLSRLIFTITDVKSLSLIKTTVDDVVTSNREGSPWQNAVLSMKTISSFEEVVRIQGDKKLTFKELFPLIDESEENHSIDDLLTALN